jgi:hypothetical protein
MPPGSWFEYLNPFDYLADAAGKVVADGWTAAMLGLWGAGLWALRLVLNLMDAFLTPDLRAAGPGAAVYRATFWVAGALVLVLAVIQLGVAAVRRDGRSLATLLIGVGQFTIVWAAWISYGVAVIAACGGLSRALMAALLEVDSWSAWRPWEPFSTSDITDGAVATVLGFLGALLWLAAVGHLLVMLTRAGALLVLAATTPICAAGLVGDAGRSWFWKSLRWFHAAAFTPVLMVLVLGVGIQLTTGVATGLADGTAAAIGTAFVSVVLILIGCFCPLALFRLLAFVDPGTSSGAALRQGLAAQGGLQGLLRGRPAGDQAGDTPGADATGTDRQGRSTGESAAEDTTTDRFTQAEAGLLAQAGGAAGSLAADGLGAMAAVGGKAAAIGLDLTNQMGVGHHGHQPDFTGMRGTRRAADGGVADPDDIADDIGPGDDHDPGDPPGHGNQTTGPTDPAAAPDPPQPPVAPTPTPAQAPDPPGPGQPGPGHTPAAADTGTGSTGGAAAAARAGAAAG